MRIKIKTEMKLKTTNKTFVDSYLAGIFEGDGHI